jgi:hypothetical protein
MPWAKDEFNRPHSMMSVSFTVMLYWSASATVLKAKVKILAAALSGKVAPDLLAVAFIGAPLSIRALNRNARSALGVAVELFGGFFDGFHAPT